MDLNCKVNDEKSFKVKRKGDALSTILINILLEKATSNVEMNTDETIFNR
jgi:hypothetical protein